MFAVKDKKQDLGAAVFIENKSQNILLHDIKRKSLILKTSNMGESLV